jgi:hypothetical protein
VPRFRGAGADEQVPRDPAMSGPPRVSGQVGARRTEIGQITRSFTDAICDRAKKLGPTEAVAHARLTVCIDAPAIIDKLMGVRGGMGRQFAD